MQSGKIYVPRIFERIACTVGKIGRLLDHMQDSARTTNRARLAAAHAQGLWCGLRHTLHAQLRSCTTQERYATAALVCTVCEADNVAAGILL